MRWGYKAAAAIALVCLLVQSSSGVAQTQPAPQSPPPAPVEATAAPGVVPIPPERLEAFVDGVVRDAMAGDHIPGVTVSVVQNGQTVLKKGYGFASLSPARPVDPDRTLFRIASISKTFTWIAVMREVEKGRMRLEAPINLYLPERVQVRDQGFTQPVRLADIMNHTPGFEDRALGQLFEKDPARVRPQLTYLRQERPRREFRPGSTPAYSNYGVALAGAAVSYVAQRPFEAIIERDITQPLGMNYTTFRDPYPGRADLPAPMSRVLAANLADGYMWTPAGWKKRPYEYTSQIAPAGGASTTAGDMARYMTMILNGGSLDGAVIYGPQTAAGFTRAQAPGSAEVGGPAHGFLQMALPGGRKGWGHDGVLLSFRSSMVMSPELGLGVFVATNGETGERLTSQLASRIVEEFYGPSPALPKPGSGWLKENASAFEGQYLASRRSFHGLEKFIGLIDSRVKVDVVGDGVLLISGYGFSSRWLPVGTDGTFRQADGWRTIAFDMQEGRAVGYHSGGGVNYFSRAGFFGGMGWLTNLGILALICAAATVWGLIQRMIKRDSRESTLQGRASLLQTIQSLLWILAALCLAIWAGKASDITAIFFDWPGGWMLTASSAALVASILSVLVLALLPFLWRSGRRVDSWTTGRKLRFTVTAVIYAAFSIVLALWGAVFPWAS